VLLEYGFKTGCVKECPFFAVLQALIKWPEYYTRHFPLGYVTLQLECNVFSEQEKYSNHLIHKQNSKHYMG
jgi:glutathione peroxidase-family protein